MEIIKEVVCDDLMNIIIGLDNVRLKDYVKNEKCFCVWRKWCGFI